MSSAHSSSESRCAPSRPQSASCSGAWRPAPSATSSPRTSANNRRERLQVRHREGHRARRGLQPGTGALARLGGARVVLHQLDQDSLGIAHAGAASARPAERIGERRRAGRHGALQGPVEVGDRNGHRRVADVARPPVGRQRAHEGAPELEQLDLEEVLAVDQPPAGRGRARHALHHRGERAGEQVGAARGLQPEHLPVPALGPAQVGDAERDLAQAHRADPSRGGVAQSRVSSPTVSGSGSSATRRTASRTPGMNERRSIESWRIESVWPSPPKITS